MGKWPTALKALRRAVKMKSWVAKPQHEALTNIVECYWYAKDDPKDVMILPPAVSNDILLNLKPPTTIFDVEHGKYFLEGNYFSGVRTHFFHVDQHGGFEIYGLRFKPWIMALFLGLPPAGQVNSFLQIDERHPSLSCFNVLGKCVKADSTLDEMVTLFDDFLMSNYSFESEVQNVFEKIFESVNSASGVSVGDLVSQTGLSTSSIERHFKRYIGISPKAFFRILRYHEIWKALNDPKYTSWADIVYEQGYFDQSHFIKEFKRFTGKSPSSYIKDRNSTLDRYRLY